MPSKNGDDIMRISETIGKETHRRIWLLYLRKSRQDDPTETVEEVLAKHEAQLQEWAERELGARIPEENIYREIVSGESIDARDKQNLCWVYSVDFNVASRKNPKKNLRLPSEGKLKLGNLPQGKWRHLTAAEVAALKK